MPWIEPDELDQLQRNDARFRFVLRAWATMARLTVAEAIAELDQMVAEGEDVQAFFQARAQRPERRQRKDVAYRR